MVVKVHHRSGQARQRLIGNVAALYLLQGLNYVIPVVTLPYLVRTLGVQAYGVIAFAQAFAQYFSVLTDYGFNFSATRYIAKNRTERESVAKMFWCVMFIKMILLCSGCLVLAVVLEWSSRFNSQALFFVIAYLSVIGSALYPQWYFQGMEQMKQISLVTGSARVITSAMLFIFVHSSADALTALGVLSAAPLLAGIIGFVVAYRDLRPAFYRPTIQELREVMIDGWHLFISTAAISLYTNTNVFLVGLIAGEEQAGYFSAAEKLIRAFTGLLGPITQAFFPHINMLVSEGRERALVFIRKALNLTASLSLLPSFTMIFFSGPIAHLLFGKNAAGSIPILPWIAPLPFLITVTNALGIQTMLSFGLDKQFSRILVSAGILNVVLAFPLIHLAAAKGAAISLLTTEIAVTIAMIIVLDQQKIYLFRKADVV